MERPKRSWSRKSLAASPSPGCYRAISPLLRPVAKLQKLWSQMERGVNLSHILGKTHLSTGTVEAPRYAGQQKTSAQGKHGGPLGQHLLLLGVGREEHIIQFILMTGAATLLSSTANDFCWSSGTVFLKALPQFCMQQPGEGPEQGLPH